MLELQEEKPYSLILLSLFSKVLYEVSEELTALGLLAQTGETFHHEINLQQVSSKMTFV